MSYGFGFDEEAVYQDADVEQAQYEQESAEAAALKKQGVCLHGWGLGAGHVYSDEEVLAERKRAGDFPDRGTDLRKLKAGEMLCLDCGAVVEDLVARAGG